MYVPTRTRVFPVKMAALFRVRQNVLLAVHLHWKSIYTSLLICEYIYVKMSQRQFCPAMNFIGAAAAFLVYIGERMSQIVFNTLTDLAAHQTADNILCISAHCVCTIRFEILTFCWLFANILKRYATEEIHPRFM